MNMNEVARRTLNEIILNFLENPKTQQQQKNSQWKNPKQTNKKNTPQNKKKLIPYKKNPLFKSISGQLQIEILSD